eukprot:GFYU01002398.1.p1 GENE.GFYU01002398.1~~GFYU01002398.1.p1  ORF type:complete len:543 (-),score=97.26 GFYU01002398.1:111-1739(-)
MGRNDWINGLRGGDSAPQPVSPRRLANNGAAAANGRTGSNRDLLAQKASASTSPTRRQLAQAATATTRQMYSGMQQSQSRQRQGNEQPKPKRELPSSSEDEVYQYEIEEDGMSYGYRTTPPKGRPSRNRNTGVRKSEHGDQDEQSPGSGAVYDNGGGRSHDLENLISQAQDVIQKVNELFPGERDGNPQLQELEAISRISGNNTSGETPFQSSGKHREYPDLLRNITSAANRKLLNHLENTSNNRDSQHMDEADTNDSRAFHQAQAARDAYLRDKVWREYDELLAQKTLLARGYQGAQRLLENKEKEAQLWKSRCERQRQDIHKMKDTILTLKGMLDRTAVQKEMHWSPQEIEKLASDLVGDARRKQEKHVQDAIEACQTHNSNLISYLQKLALRQPTLRYEIASVVQENTFSLLDASGEDVHMELRGTADASDIRQSSRTNPHAGGGDSGRAMGDPPRGSGREVDRERSRGQWDRPSAANGRVSPVTPLSRSPSPSPARSPNRSPNRSPARSPNTSPPPSPGSSRRGLVRNFATSQKIVSR